MSPLNTWPPSVSGIPVPIAEGGTGATTASGARTNLGTVPGTNNFGYLNIPQNAQSDSYTTVAADSGKHILETGAGKTVTINKNATVPYALGTALTVIPTDAGGCSLAIDTDTLIWAQDGSTGTRTLAQYAVATAIKVDTTTWIVSGVGIS